MAALHAGGQTLPGRLVLSNGLEQTVRTLLCRQVGLRVGLLSAVGVGVGGGVVVGVDPTRVGDDPLLLKVLTFLVESVLEELLLQSHVFTEIGRTGERPGRGEVGEVLGEADPLSGGGGGGGHHLAVFALQYLGLLPHLLELDLARGSLSVVEPLLEGDQLEALGHQAVTAPPSLPEVDGRPGGHLPPLLLQAAGWRGLAAHQRVEPQSRQPGGVAHRAVAVTVVVVVVVVGLLSAGGQTLAPGRLSSEAAVLNALIVRVAGPAAQ